MHISQLFIHPVKSLRGFSVDAAKLTPQGLQHDRQWMVVSESKRFITQRKYPQMALIHTAIENQQLILTKPSQKGFPPLIIDINTIPRPKAFDAVIWKDTCQVLDEGTVASQWLSKALGIEAPVHLVRMADTPRPQSKPEILGEDTHTYFADAAPFLVANEASLERVNEQLADEGHLPVLMENFRPNIVVTGIKAFAEHDIQQLTHENYTLKHCYPCKRCIMPTIDTKTGIRHPQQEPFSLIADINPMPENAKAPAFGENAILLRGEDQHIRVGDVLDYSEGS